MDFYNTRKPRNTMRYFRKNYLTLYLMMLPGLIYILINNYIPMFGIILAFKSSNLANGIFGGEYIGFKNFEFLFATKDAFIITRNVILYNLSFIIIGLVVQILVAVMLHEITNTFYSRLYQSIIVIPALISMVIVSYITYGYLSADTGLFNKSILPALGIDPIMWYSEPKYWPFILIFVNIWKNTGFGCIIYLATIVGINPELYEAAKLDGASKIQQIKNITLPMLKPVVITMTILAIGKIFYADFGLFYQVPMDSGALYDVTNTIDTYVYRSLMNIGDIGMSSAAGLYQSLVGFILVIASNLILRKVNPENSLF